MLPGVQPFFLIQCFLIRCAFKAGILNPVIAFMKFLHGKSVKAGAAHYQ